MQDVDNIGMFIISATRRHIESIISFKTKVCLGGELFFLGKWTFLFRHYYWIDCQILLTLAKEVKMSFLFYAPCTCTCPGASKDRGPIICEMWDWD